MVAQVLSYFELCSLKDDTFEKLMMIKSNHHSKFVNNLKIADQLSKILKYQTPMKELVPSGCILIANARIHYMYI